MENNNNNRKTKEQRIWELRKMQMAGIQVDKTKITHLDEPLINLSYRTNLFLNHKYYISGIEKIIDTKSEMYAIGNKESKYYDSLKDTIDVFNGNIHVINPINEDIFRKNTQQTFETLPVYRLKNEFLKFYKDNSIMVITGETGCGKSTLVPKLIYDKFGHRIAITQPRRVAVKSLFERMKGFYKDEVGYAMKFDSRLTSKTKIKFMTEGVLLKEIAKDEDLGMYDTIILDEAHERSVNMDILLALLKRISKTRPNLKIIIMSATIIISKFVDFFNCKSFTFDGKQFPVDINYLEVDVDDYIEWTVKKTISLVHSDDNKGDILMFLSGKDDVDKTFRLLCNFLNTSKQHLAIIKCYSEILNDVYQHIFTNDSATRKIILSTNISEASVTIPNIKYVIDSGFHKLVVHDYSQGEVLIRCPISKENAIQRAGRCGRTSKGICFRMYTKKTFDKLVDCTPPEIIRSDLSNILLHLVDLNVSDISKIHLMDTPSYELVESCYDFLILLGALDDARKMTQLGRTIIDLGCDCSTGKLIYEGMIAGCSYEMIILISMLNYHNKFVVDLLTKVNTKKSQYYNLVANNNDFLTLINIYKHTDLIDKDLKRNCSMLADKCKRSLSQNISSSEDTNKITKVVLRSLFFNISRRVDKKFVNLISRSTFDLPKFTTLDDELEYVTYYKTFKGKDKNYAYLCMKIDPKEVLKTLGSVFEDKKERLYKAKPDKLILSLDNSNVYDNFELEEENYQRIKKRKRFVL